MGAIGRVEFEDRLKTGVLIGFGDCMTPKINANSPLRCGLVLGMV